MRWLLLLTIPFLTAGDGGWGESDEGWAGEGWGLGAWGEPSASTVAAAQAEFVGVLDRANAPALDAAYGFIRLKTGYGEPTDTVITLREDGTNTHQAFFFIDDRNDARDGRLNLTAIESFRTSLGGDTLRVVRAFDLTGNGNHLTQTTQNSQPAMFVTGGPDSEPCFFFEPKTTGLPNDHGGLRTLVASASTVLDATTAVTQIVILSFTADSSFARTIAGKRAANITSGAATGYQIGLGTTERFNASIDGPDGAPITATGSSAINDGAWRQMAQWGSVVVNGNVADDTSTVFLNGGTVGGGPTTARTADNVSLTNGIIYTLGTFSGGSANGYVGKVFFLGVDAALDSPAALNVLYGTGTPNWADEWCQQP